MLKKGSLFRDKLIKDELGQDLRAVCDVDIYTEWNKRNECIMYIDGEVEYMQVTIGVDQEGKIYCDYTKKEKNGQHIRDIIKKGPS